jgi:hypothetical protein
MAKQNKNKNKKQNKLTQAERQVLNWTGIEPDGSKVTTVAKDRKSPRSILNILTKDVVYTTNPELAFGIVRRLLTGNFLKSEDFTWFINNHPVFAQLTEQAFFGDANMEVDGDLLESASASKWGQENKPNRTLEVSGDVEITYVSKDGVKTELVHIGWEMIRYETDSRPYVALNCGGGSAIRRFLLRTGPRPDYTINDDANSRRYVMRGKSVDESLQEEEILAEAETDSLMDQLLSGETVTLGL